MLLIYVYIYINIYITYISKKKALKIVFSVAW